MTTRYAMTETEIEFIRPYIDGPALQLWIQQGITLTERSMISRALDKQEVTGA